MNYLTHVDLYTKTVSQSALIYILLTETDKMIRMSYIPMAADGVIGKLESTPSTEKFPLSIKDIYSATGL